MRVEELKDGPDPRKAAGGFSMLDYALTSGLTMRFWSKVDEFQPGGCWTWKAAKDPAGYGMLTINSVNTRAHRVVWEDRFGDIPRGKHVDHKCRNRACVNPGHLHLVTPAENSQHRNGIKNGTSKYRGVSFYKRTGKWTARGRLNHKVYHLGYFDTEEEAAEVARQWRLRHYTNSLMDKRVAKLPPM